MAREKEIDRERTISFFKALVDNFLSGSSQLEDTLTPNQVFTLIIYRVFIKYCVFFLKISKYSGLWPFSVFPRC